MSGRSAARCVRAASVPSEIVPLRPAQPGPRLLIFDFDGTLADSWPWLLGALDDTALRFGLHRVSSAEAEALRGQDNRAVMRALGVPIWKLPQTAKHMRPLAAEAPPPPLFPGIPDMLRRLAAAGRLLAIASSNGEAQIRRTLGPELAGLVRHYASEASLFGKANRFRRILRASRMPAAEAIAIGDEVRDIEAAREAGLAAGAVAWGYAWPSLLAARQPDALFDSPEAVARFCGA
jgi:phosphoglycolate phosphatase